jgi:conjugative relaxase-like TrwC/TraI family protein
MFTMAKIRDGSTYLGKHLTSNDYYCENEAVTGRWVGKAAERLGLTSEINAEDKAFEALRNNRHPETGEKLTARDADARIRFYDFQCSAPKSVSVMAVTVGDARLLAAHDRAAAVAFRELEKFAATQANSALVRSNRITGNVVAACFRHTASRALDAQVHTHHVTANATWDGVSKSWRALTEFEMLRAIRYAGKVYQNELGIGCRDCGYGLTEVQNERGIVTGFEISGVSDEIRERFSKRRAEIEVGIEAFREKHGRTPTTAEVHAITVATRNVKLKEVTTPEVLAAQRAQLSGDEWSHLDVLKSQAERQSLLPSTPEVPRERESLRLAIGHIYERRSVAEGHEVLAEALNQNLGHLHLAYLHAQADRTGLVALTPEPLWLRTHLATARGLAQERWSVAFIEGGKDKLPALVQDVRERVAGLSEEQDRALKEVLATRDQVVCLRGAAGVGKTTVIKQLHDKLADDGRTVFYCAPTTSAADTLRKDGISGATTVSDFLKNGVFSERPRLNGAVLVVDEAGLSSNNQGAELLQVARRYDARVVFIGDSKQHSSVEAGDFLRILETHSPLHTVELSDIRRQTVAEYRRAVKMMAVGGALSGLEALDRMGWVREGKANYLSAAVQDFIDRADGGRRLEAVLAVTPTWAESFAFTDLLRAELKARGLLSNGETVSVHEPMAWTKAQKRRAENFQPGQVVTIQRSSAGFKRGQALAILRVEGGKVFVKAGKGERVLPLRQLDIEVARVRPMEVCDGDKVLIRANDRKAGLINGEVLSVAAIKDGGITFSDGRKVDARQFHALAHGFAVTSHKSQSKSAEHVIVAAERLDAMSAYVACSRGRLSCTVHTPDKESLMGRLPDGTREAGLDFSPPASNASRETAWTKASDDLHEAAMERGNVVHRALSHPWWRGLMHNLAEWSERTLARNRVDEMPERDGPEQSSP